jgi:hypothetical protein
MKLGALRCRFTALGLFVLLSGTVIMPSTASAIIRDPSSPPPDLPVQVEQPSVSESTGGGTLSVDTPVVVMNPTPIEIKTPEPTKHASINAPKDSGSRSYDAPAIKHKTSLLAAFQAWKQKRDTVTDVAALTVLDMCKTERAKTVLELFRPKRTCEIQPLYSR